MQQPVVVPAARALDNDYRCLAQCRAYLWMAEGTSTNKSPNVCDRWRFEREVQISALRSGALYREGSDLRLKSNVQHQIADPFCGKPSRSTRLKQETESSHAVCLTFALSRATLRSLRPAPIAGQAARSGSQLASSSISASKVALPARTASRGSRPVASTASIASIGDRPRAATSQAAST
jgi:hypothetical protein